MGSQWEGTHKGVKGITIQARHTKSVTWEKVKGKCKSGGNACVQGKCVLWSKTEKMRIALLEEREKRGIGRRTEGLRVRTL